MKILWHMPTLRSRACGLSKRAVCLARELIARGHDVRFIVRRGCTDLGGGRIGTVPIQVVDVNASSPVHWSLQGLCRAAIAEAVVQQIDAPHDLFISCQPEVVTAYRNEHPKRTLLFVCGGSTILHDEADLTRRKNRSATSRLAYGLDAYVKHRNEKSAFDAANAIVFDSESTRQMVVSAYELNPGKCFAIYGGVDPSEFHVPTVEECKAARNGLGIGESEGVIAWTGRISAEKNVGCLIEAVGRCQHKDIKALIVGDGPDAPGLRQFTSELQIEDRICFAGESGDVRPFLYAADAFVFPSIGESFGGSLAEAMACGLACIALRSDGHTIRNACSEILDHGSCGLLVERNDPGFLAEAIDRLFDQPALRQELGDAAARRAGTAFTWKSAGSDLQSLLVRLMSQRGKKPANEVNKKPSPPARVAVESIFG